MAKNIDRIAQQLDATKVGKVPPYSAGAFGAAALAEALRERLAPSRGRRPGRPSDPAWSRRPKVPMAPVTEDRLRELARMVSSDERKVSPMQVAAAILEHATASYFRPTRATPTASRVGTRAAAASDHRNRRQSD